MFHTATIAGDWTALVQRLDRDATLTRWGVSEPALVGVARVDEIVAALSRGGDPDRADGLVGALVRLAADRGARDDDALLLLLHLLSAGALSLSRRLGDLSPDITAIVVNELACQIRAYPLHRRRRAWAANLLSDTRRAVLAEFRPWARRPGAAEYLVDPHSSVWDTTPLGRRVPGPGEDEDLDVGDLLRWAVRDGVDRGDVALLVATERGRAANPKTSQDARVATEQGVALRTLYRRRERTLSALREAAQNYLGAVA